MTWLNRELTLDDGSEGPAIFSSVTPEETLALQQHARGRRVLELGSAYGYSACAMALGGAEHITAVDLHTPHLTNLNAGDTLEVMEANLSACGVADRVTVIRQDTGHALAAMRAAGEKFAMVFIDADHDEIPFRRDLAGALALIPPGGILACHDYRSPSEPDIAKVLDELYPQGPSALTGSLWVLEVP